MDPSRYLVSAGRSSRGNAITWQAAACARAIESARLFAGFDVGKETPRSNGTSCVDLTAKLTFSGTVPVSINLVALFSCDTTTPTTAPDSVTTAPPELPG